MQTQFVEFHRATCYPETKRDDMTTVSNLFGKLKARAYYAEFQKQGDNRNPEISHGLDALLNF